MSRHRNVRNLDYDDELNDWYGGSYGHSVGDDYAVSPETASHYTYGRGGSRRSRVDSTSLEKTDEVDDEVEGEVEDEVEFNRALKESLSKGLSATQRAMLLSCVEQLQDTVGDTISEAKLMEAASLANYDHEKALDIVLNANVESIKSNSSTKAINSTTPKVQITETTPASNSKGELNATQTLDDENGKGELANLDLTEFSFDDFLIELDELEQVETDPNAKIRLRLHHLLDSADLKVSKIDFKRASELIEGKNKRVAKSRNRSLFYMCLAVRHKMRADKKRFSLNEMDIVNLIKRFMNVSESVIIDIFGSPSPDSRLGAAQGRDLSVDSTKKPQVDTALLTSSLGRRLNFGPGQANILPDDKVFLEEEAPPAGVSQPERLATIPAFKTLQTTPSVPQRKLSKGNLATPLRSQSPSSREGSRRSSPAPLLTAKEAARSKTFTSDAAVAAYAEDRSDKKPLINLVVIGHVDAGKSTLMGRLLFDLGYVSKKSMHRYETDSKKTGKASFLYAWVLDETEEERTRGITMDIAQSRFETKERQVTLLDAPGHKDFIPNMITGASQADVALLVVDATNGEFEAGFDAGGQTREHTLLVRSLGVSQLGVVVNKLDNCGWSNERYTEIVLKLGHFLKQVGFKETDVTFVPCSGLNGSNLATRSKEPGLVSWYSGPCLVEVIDMFKPPERLVSKPFRMSITDIFKGLSSGISVSGRVESGAAQLGQKVLVMPAAEASTIKGISLDEVSVAQVFAGDHVTVVLAGCDPNKLTVGSIVCDATAPTKITSKFEARIVVFHNADVPITKGLPVVLHYNGTTEQATIKRLLSQINKSSGEVIKRKPRCLTKNSSGLVELEVARPICVELYKEFKDLGRFMMRVGGATVAAGLVNKIL